MSVEIKQLVIKSNIANQATKGSVSEKDKEINQQSSAPIDKISNEELLADVTRICKYILDKELRKKKER